MQEELKQKKQQFAKQANLTMSPSKMAKGERNKELNQDMDFNSYRQLVASPTKSIGMSVLSSKKEREQLLKKQHKVNILMNYQDEYGKTMKFLDEKVLKKLNKTKEAETEALKDELKLGLPEDLKHTFSERKDETLEARQRRN